MKLQLWRTRLESRQGNKIMDGVGLAIILNVAMLLIVDCKRYFVEGFASALNGK
jgi:hypothetical protein